MSCIIILELHFKGALKMYRSLCPIPAFLRSLNPGGGGGSVGNSAYKVLPAGPQISFGELLVKNAIWQSNT